MYSSHILHMPVIGFGSSMDTDMLRLRSVVIPAIHVHTSHENYKKKLKFDTEEKNMEKNNNFLVALCGKSGSGKTTVASYLAGYMGWKSIESYTTRPRRKLDEQGHIFITNEEFDRIRDEEMIVYTEFDGHHYCATMGQVEEAQIYVIDPAGIRELDKRYCGEKRIITVFIEVDDHTLMERMMQRGDGKEKAEKRAENDRYMFRDVQTEFIVDGTKDVAEVASEIIDIVERVSA